MSTLSSENSALATALEKIGQFQGKSAFGTWLTRIAINQMHTRRCQQGVSLDALEEAHFECGEPDRVSDDVERLETDQKLRRALNKLPERNRQVLTDHFLRGYSIKEIAQRRQIPLGTVLSRISAGKRLLRRAWARASAKAVR